jgi:hypothetical protein
MGYLATSLDCCDCTQSFPFSADEQSLGAELGFAHPRRCDACRRTLDSSRRSIADDARPHLSRLRAAIPHRATSDVLAAAVPA